MQHQGLDLLTIIHQGAIATGPFDFSPLNLDIISSTWRKNSVHPSSFRLQLFSRGAVAQLGERLNGIQEVVGSIPIGSTKFLQSKNLVPRA